jgi:hypothetical protein
MSRAVIWLIVWPLVRSMRLTPPPLLAMAMLEAGALTA